MNRADKRRFFADDSFWNTPLGDSPEIEERSSFWQALLPLAEPPGGVYINMEKYTIPVYAVDDHTPRHDIGRSFVAGGRFGRYADSPIARVWNHRNPLGFGPGFGRAVPIPDDARPDPASDAHLALIDYEAGRVWDMWGAHRDEAGEWWTYSGNVYDLYGSGLFDPADYPYPNGEKIHTWGPARAAGVPIIAGLILKREVQSGRIEHKVAAACSMVGFLEYAYPPAISTDGRIPGGIPEGNVVQLDPKLDLDTLGLKPGAKVVARTLQEYGMVMTDGSDSLSIYAEAPWTPHCGGWEGLLAPNDLRAIPQDRFRFIKADSYIERGTAGNGYFSKTDRETWPLAVRRLQKWAAEGGAKSGND